MRLRAAAASAGVATVLPGAGSAWTGSGTGSQLGRARLGIERGFPAGLEGLVAVVGQVVGADVRRSPVHGRVGPVAQLARPARAHALDGQVKRDLGVEATTGTGARTPERWAAIPA